MKKNDKISVKGLQNAAGLNFTIRRGKSYEMESTLAKQLIRDRLVELVSDEVEIQENEPDDIKQPVVHPPKSVKAKAPVKNKKK